MAEICGFNGSVTLPAGVKFAVTGWAGKLAHDKVVIPPAFGDRMKKTKLGAGSFSGSLEGNLIWNVAASKPFDMAKGGGEKGWEKFEAAVTLTAETGCTIAGTMVFSNVDLNVKNGGLGTIKCDIDNSKDDLVVTWDETA